MPGTPGGEMDGPRQREKDKNGKKNNASHRANEN